MNDTVSIGSSPRRIRQNNIVAALQTIYAHRSLSRADLARKLGMNRSSSGEIVAELTEGGFVQESDESGKQRSEPSRAGRPGIMLELVPDAAFFVGIEIGVEHISAAVIDLSAEVRACRKMAFDTPSSTVEEAVAQGVELIVGVMAKRMIGRCKGLGISTPAHIRPDGFVTLAPIIDLATSVSVNGYEHPQKVKDRTHLRTVGDVFPHAATLSRNGDMDHPDPFDAHGPPGQTGDHNAAPLGRRHHRAKTHLAYRCQQLGLARYLWRSPHGLQRLVDATGTHELDPAQALELAHPGALEAALASIDAERLRGG